MKKCETGRFCKVGFANFPKSVKKVSFCKKIHAKLLHGIKKSLPLQRFNKQLIVLLKKIQTNEKVSFHVRSFRCYLFRFLR